MITKEYIERRFKRGKVFFVQIGSNDGSRHDPIHDLAANNLNWSGVLVEPSPEAFATLRSNYDDDGRFTFENAAISDHDGVQTFYSVSKAAEGAIANLPEWYDQLSSLDRNHIVSHLDGTLEPFIIESTVPCLTLEKLFIKNGVGHIDLLHIDAEGLDYQIMCQLNLEIRRPDMIVFESWHMTRMQLQHVYGRLKTAGYLLKEVDLDTIARRKRA